MSRKSKLLEAMRNNPQGDWTMDNVKTLAAAYGIDVRSPRRGGSHVTLSHDSQEAILTVPRAKPIKTFYIVSLVMFIDSVIESEK